MNISDLQKQIINKNIDSVLMLYGEEVAIMDIYLNKIYEALKCDVFRVASVEEAYSKIVQKRITSDAVRCFVVRDDPEFLKADKQWKKVFDTVQSSKDYLIIIYSSMDKRCKFFKSNSDRMCEFEKLSSSILAGYVAKLLPELTRNQCEKFAEICENNYSRILLEADKVQHFQNAMSVSSEQYGVDLNTADCISDLLKNGVIYKPIGDITFLFTDAILTRNYADTAKYLVQAKAIGESEILTLSVLYSGFKQILMVQGLGKDQSEPVKRTGLTAWQVKMAKQKQGHYSIAELIRALKIIRSVEKGIKTGTIDADIAVEYVIVNIM